MESIFIDMKIVAKCERSLNWMEVGVFTEVRLSSSVGENVPNLFANLYLNTHMVKPRMRSILKEIIVLSSRSHKHHKLSVGNIHQF